MGDRILCLVDRLPGLLLGTGFVLYHIPLLLVVRDAEAFSAGGGRLIALFVVGMDVAVAGAIARIYQSMGMRFGVRDALQLAGLIPISLGLYLIPPELSRAWFLVYALYTLSFSRMDRISPFLGLAALMALAFQMVLQDIQAPLSRTLRDFGWLFLSVGLGEVLDGCPREEVL